MSEQTWIELSTGHLDEETIVLFEGLRSMRKHWPAMTLAKYEYGYFLGLPWFDGMSAEQWNVLPTALRKILRHFEQRRGELHGLRFDAEGDIVDELLTYEWS